MTARWLQNLKHSFEKFLKIDCCECIEPEVQDLRADNTRLRGMLAESASYLKQIAPSVRPDLYQHGIELRAKMMCRALRDPPGNEEGR